MGFIVVREEQLKKKIVMEKIKNASKAQQV